jgi:hypothetical protein
MIQLYTILDNSVDGLLRFCWRDRKLLHEILIPRLYFDKISKISIFLKNNYWIFEVY